MISKSKTSFPWPPGSILQPGEMFFMFCHGGPSFQSLQKVFAFTMAWHHFIPWEIIFHDRKSFSLAEGIILTMGNFSSTRSSFHSGYKVNIVGMVLQVEEDDEETSDNESEDWACRLPTDVQVTCTHKHTCAHTNTEICTFRIKQNKVVWL